jgi:tetratricopeptide (TPR) repeat protein
VSSAFLQSQIFAQQDRIDEAIEFWKEAYQGVVGTNRFPLMKNLGLLALQLDQPVNAMQSLYTAFSAGIPFNEIQAGKLIGLTMEYGSLRQAIQVADYLAGRFSDSPVHQNNLAYFRFLAEEQVEESVEVMRGLVEEYSDIPQFRLTLALGLVKSGRSNEANRLLKSTNINWQETSTRGLLIYCVVLAASDQQTLAQGLLQSLDTEVLIPEEKALLESF